ncbi:peptide/nickel transport system ATP-binding protein [Parafrankia irregularis]|uniref:Peptide/nickel transport system ATP-binding protein n=1 Tax=Parafrankia irregularis TaxID=795642 RepID=A0A0S4R0S0_9ACTN|nr:MULTISPECIES: ABC transporter ATP-binding protein [Parafrankia]MBE3201457.1 ABC transporter ATP-binding protein [Parafrankia sp. CH37]CUU60330.1 peptide/nickel transport system ATP-binding protein [Parafrankia irregularis]
MTTGTVISDTARREDLAEESGPPILRVEGMTVRYDSSRGDVVAVDDVSFSLGRGERVALVGESGSGKTTLGLALAGFLTQPSVHITHERLEFDGVPVSRVVRTRLPVRTPGLSMVFQDAMTTLDPVWTIGSQLAAVIRAQRAGATGTDGADAGAGAGAGRRWLHRRADRAAIREISRHWLTKVGLRDTDRVLRARPYELSGGMRQRAMIAIALCGSPRLLIADEPTSALDASLARDAMEMLLGLTRESGASVLVISHDILLAQEYTDRTFVMYGGRIVEKRSSAKLAETATHPYTVGLLRCVPTLDSAELDELPTLASVAAASAPAAPAPTPATAPVAKAPAPAPPAPARTPVAPAQRRPLIRTDRREGQ